MWDGGGEISEKKKVIRDYQQKIVQEATKSNTIVVLPTGSGKTFIAVQLIKNLSKNTRIPFKDGGKRTFFLAVTKTLVSQQCKVIQEFGLSAQFYTGDSNVDSWNIPKWRAQLSSHQVIVMTPQILVNILANGCLSPKEINLIIFDECHHGSKQHPYSVIMNYIQSVSEDNRPLVLGLTATLFNMTVTAANIVSAIKKVLQTFDAKLCSAEEHQVAQFATNPIEIFSIFDDEDCDLLVQHLLEFVDKKIELLSNVVFPSDFPVNCEHRKRRVCRAEAVNNLNDLREHLKALGCYGGSIAALYHLVKFEHLSKRSINKIENDLYKMLMSVCTYVRVNLLNYMQRLGDPINLIYCSSSKVLKLIDVIRACWVELERDKKPFKCILFVERRITAVVLYHLFTKCKQDFEFFNFLKPDLIVGGTDDPSKLLNEDNVDKRKLRAVVSKFDDSVTNLLVATSCVEEGIDISLCNLVIKFDRPSDYRSYVQSKGRARSKESKFVIMIEESKQDYVNSVIRNFKNTEQALRDYLYKNKQNDVSDDFENDVDLENYIPPIQNPETGGLISSETCINVLNLYCRNLPQDSYTHYEPLWFYKQDNMKYECSVQLPMCCPLKETITGNLMSGKKWAKISAAMEACKKLIELGEPLRKLTKEELFRFFVERCNLFWLFPNLSSDTNEEDNIRQYPVKHANCLSWSRPTPNTTCYIHVLQFEPFFRPFDHVDRTYFELLNSQTTFGILSSKPAPPIFDFSIFMVTGEVKCSVKVNACVVQLSPSEIKYVEKFHFNIFYDMFLTNQNFGPLVFDKEEVNRSYLIVPVKNVESAVVIDWSVISDGFVRHENGVHVGEDLKTNDRQSYLHKIVQVHEGNNKTTFVVINVLENNSPLSVFPSSKYSTYKDYFFTRYGINVDSSQPLLEVLPLMPNVSYKSLGDKNLSDKTQVFIPQLCLFHRIPAGLWVKSLTLPVVLKRVEIAFNVDELRCQILKDINFSVFRNSPWLPLPSGETRKKKCITDNTVNYNKQLDHSSHDLEDILCTEIESMLCISQTSVTKSFKSSNHKTNTAHSINYRCKLSTLEKKNSNFTTGPELRRMFEAITTTEACDVVDLEKLEVWGDSFLKFATSIYLLRSFPYHDGYLSAMREQLVGNRNLRCCGEKRQLPGLVNNFKLLDYWRPPFFSIPKELQTLIYNGKINAKELKEIVLNKEDKFFNCFDLDDHFNISHSTEYVSKELIESYLDLKVLTNKTIADCVESLTACFLETYGVIGGLKFVDWIGILPLPDEKISQIFTHPNIDSDTTMLHQLLETVDVKELESTLGYTFKNKCLLLEALTHPSFLNNRLTDSYQRLEFLGDSILDFLITTYAFEMCKDMSPGEIFDFRSSIVSNINLACLAVKCDLQKHILLENPCLIEDIYKFMTYLEDNEDLNEDLILIILEDRDCSVARGLDVPKVLSDVCESLIGAIFLDSNDLTIVWDVVFKLMKDEIVKFSQDIPKDTVKMLYELCSPTFTTVIDSLCHGVTHVRCSVVIDGEINTFDGFGKNGKVAKTSAAKLALRAVMRSNVQK